MEKSEFAIKIPIISFFNFRDFFLGIAVIGLMILVSLFFVDSKGPGNDLAWLRGIGAFFFYCQRLYAL